MPRRRASVLDVFVLLPWWASAIAGGLAYLGLMFVGPGLLGGDSARASVVTTARWLAPYVALVFVLTGFASWFRALLIARRFNAQNGIDDVRKLSWRQFESIVGEAFRRRGYTVMENAVDGPDGGIDLVLRKDGARYFVQCKQWKQLKVGVKPVRELLGVVTAGAAAGGIFVTSGEYTREAREFATSSGLKLIDGAELVNLIEEARASQPYMHPTIRGREPTVSALPREPECPTCGGAMVRRTAKRGVSVGSQFWGCAQYPSCRGTRAA